jgi:hypothetical protein
MAFVEPTTTTTTLDGQQFLFCSDQKNKMSTGCVFFSIPHGSSISSLFSFIHHRTYFPITYCTRVLLDSGLLSPSTP